MPALYPQMPYLQVVAAEWRGAYPEAATRANGRIDKALGIAAGGCVSSTNLVGIFRVTSQSDPRQAYTVNRNTKACECADYLKGNRICKHRLAVNFVIKALGRMFADAQSLSDRRARSHFDAVFDNDATRMAATEQSWQAAYEELVLVHKQFDAVRYEL